MIKLLEQAIASVQGLSERHQELAAEFLLGFANPAAHHHQLTDDQVRGVELAYRWTAIDRDYSTADYFLVATVIPVNTKP
jgi:hypothetical protein